MSTLKVNTIQEADGSAFPFIGMQDSWMITSSFNANGEADMTSNWGKHSAGSTGQGNIGTGMSESSGIFSFPSTGIYLVISTLVASCNGGRTFVGMRQKFTTDGSNFTENVEFFGNGYQNTAFITVNGCAVYDVTNTSTHKIKFQHNISDTVSLKGYSNKKATGVTFTKLGET